MSKQASAYTATQDSLIGHPVPDWFRDAKFGIFIHWGPYSIPAFAPHQPEKSEGSADNVMQAFKYNPYAEWYLNTMKFEDGPTAQFHRETYGADYSYDHFGDAFNASLENWDPVAWAKLFKRSGARYVVLVSKHHDGFLLWPSKTPNPHKPNWQTTRDVVGELAAAARAEGLKFGIYYSGGIDWTFKDKCIESIQDLMAMPGEAEGYIEYANAHYHELIERYQPDYLWNDIGYPSEQSSFDIIADYYNTVPEGLTNDRWISPDGELQTDAFERPEGMTGVLPPKPPVWDIRTPEYGMFDHILPFLWETTRGMGHSFAYNQHEGDADYLTPGAIATMIASSACFNGNVLLNVGPRGDAQLDPAQADRLEDAGAWLAKYGQAIQGTRPVELSRKTLDGVNIGATRDTNSLYLHMFGKPGLGALEIELPSDVRTVSSLEQIGGQVGDWSFDQNTLRLNVNEWADEAVQIFKLGLSL
ncbi:MAG: alpha-L-fucosidase [Alphaproteobacteria bacterium]|nr:alpha-L-fucosidase [Alphaproteobacteria bacterium]MBU2085178.1 alpha-L-fucosidase [Alphaproteobacteria bacterium]MBU2142108.1 alpha-L-fucosidase [Alphaproteobacteria bacterium]MBU2197000.1 alpha-L-fucosidase [Alphaproteobacteria bacterium]